MPTNTSKPQSVQEFIELSAERGLTRSENGLPYAALSFDKESFRLAAVPYGNVDALVTNILDRYDNGILAYADGQVSLICNWAHAQGIDAQTLLRQISQKVLNLGELASDYQKETRTNIEDALARMEAQDQVA